MNLPADARLIQIHLNLLGSGNLLALHGASRVFAFLIGHADRDETIAGIHVRPLGGRARSYGFRDNSVRVVNPGDSVGSRTLSARALPKIDGSGHKQQRRRRQQQPGSGCEYRGFHRLHRPGE